MKHEKHIENKELLDKLTNDSKKETEKKLKSLGKKIVAALILTGSLHVGASLLPNDETSITTTPNAESSSQSPQSSNDTVESKVYIDTYNGVDYIFCNEEYVLEIAEQSLTRVENLLKTINGITPVGTDNGNFYPEYFTKYLLTALAHTESTYRICHADGSPLVSSAGAIGMMQIRPETLEGLNYWLKNTMNLDVQYSTDDLMNPEKSMDIANLILIQYTKNHGKQNCNNPIYPYLNEPFSLSRQQEIVLAIYNNGYSNMIDYINDGCVYDYLSEGKPTNYVNKILNKTNDLEEKYKESQNN